MPTTVAVMLITMFLIIGLISISWIYFRFKERQLMFEKGMNSEEMSSLLKTKTKRSPYILVKLGVVTVIFSFGLLVGLLVEYYEGPEALISFPIILSIGAGFIAAFFVGKKLEEKEQEKLPEM